jgi:SAM-dependent methyltransferase
VTTFDVRHRAVAALAAARDRAFLPEAYAGQESFVSAAEVLGLASAAGVGAGCRVLDLCCGVGGPGRLVARATGCDLVGVDSNVGALALARANAAARARFLAASVPELPLESRFDVVLLVETVLAFSDKPALLREVARVLGAGGRFAFTFEEGQPLSDDEREAMPRGDTVWLVELETMLELLAAHGFAVRWLDDWTAEHAARAARLGACFAADGAAIAAALGERALGELLGAHLRWAEWLGDRRVRKLAVVCERM